MSAETLTKTVSGPEANKSVPTVEELDSLVNTPSVETNLDNRELSPTASLMRGAVDKITAMFERRALNKAHSEALKDDQSRTETLQNEAFDSYADNISFTQNREQDEKREAREAKIEDAKKMVNKIGRSALTGVTNAGLITLGIGILVGEAAVAKSKDLVETGSLKAMYAVDKAKDLVETGSLQAMYAVDKAKDLAETGSLYAMSATDRAKELAETGANYVVSTADKAKDMAEAGANYAIDTIDRGIDFAKETVESIRAKLEERAKIAESRREARRKRWSAFKTSAIGLGREVVDSSKEKGREALGRANAVRAAGSAAMAAATATYNTHLEQNSL
jgi:hypothetical protein